MCARSEPQPPPAGDEVVTAAIMEVVAAQGGPTEDQNAQLAQSQANSAGELRYAPMELSSQH